jgi:hypothetical protein
MTEFSMDTLTIDLATPTPNAQVSTRKTPRSSAKVHHFTAYSQVHPEAIAAFVAAKVLYEDAIADPEHRIRDRTVKVEVNGNPHPRCYIARPLSTSMTNSKRRSAPPRLCGMSIRLYPDEHVDLAERNRGADIADDARCTGACTIAAFDFRVAGGRVLHCISQSFRGSATPVGD